MKLKARWNIDEVLSLRIRPVEELIDLFWSQIEVVGECLMWTGWINKKSGYAQFNVRFGKHRRVNILAHRFAYWTAIGPIPEGLEPDHLCRHRACINPDHLELVTSQVNVLRSEGLAAKNAVKTHCPYGHEYTAENTMLKSSKKWPGRFRRYCRICEKQRSRNAWKYGRAIVDSQVASAG
jgi:hypothetical protein